MTSRKFVLTRTGPQSLWFNYIGLFALDNKAYGRAKSHYGFISSFYSQATNVATIYYNLLPKLWDLTGLWITQYAPESFSGEISKSLLFFIAFNISTTVINLPFSYYKTFVLEEKFGFNKQTQKLVSSPRAHES